VFNDCNLNKAVKDTVTSILNNTGQACIAISRIYVQEGLYSEFTKLYKQQMEKWGKLAGEPTDPATQLGPLVSLIFYDV
jgi:aldehyde dehydrogenase (NAD+)